MRTVKFRPWFRGWIHELLREGRIVEAANVVHEEVAYALGARRKRGKDASGSVDNGALDVPDVERCSSPKFQPLISPKNFNQKDEDHDQQQFRL